mgnify:CR=1 FL=1
MVLRRTVKKNGQFRLRWHIIATIWQRLCCIIWRRGTGIRGLSGIQAVNGEIIRPVLCLERKEIVNYLKERGIPISQIAAIFQMTIQETGSVTIFFRLWNRRSMQKRWSIWQKPHGFWQRQIRIFRKREGSFWQAAGKKMAIFWMKNFFAQDPILQEYAVMEAFEILSGKRKDFTSLHVDQVLSLQKKETVVISTFRNRCG